MLILGQKACFLGPTIFEIPQPNWYITIYTSVSGPIEGEEEVFHNNAIKFIILEFQKHIYLFFNMHTYFNL